MIRSVFSDLSTFKTLKFNEGLNILLADKSPGASDRQSRNGAGKTSFIEIIHFLFGANVYKDSIFKNDDLIDSFFLIDFDLNNDPITLSRSGSDPSHYIVDSGNTRDWPIPPLMNKKNDKLSIKKDDWIKVLGWFQFGLDPNNEKERRTYSPSFRSLFSYFVRRHLEGAFNSPKSYGIKQQPWNEQVSITYLLDLDWSIPQKFQRIRLDEKSINTLRTANKEKKISGIIGNAADLRTQVALAREKVRRLRSQIDTFRVLPEYEKWEKEASDLTNKISDLLNENTIDRELLSQLEDSLKNETPPEDENIINLYEEAHIILPENVFRRFSEVKSFHQKIIENRKAHLTSEIEAIKRRILQREKEKDSLDLRRSQVMAILKSGGALEHYTRLQEELGRKEAESENLSQKLDIAEKIERNKATLDIERSTLLQRLQDDYKEQREKIDEAIVTFENLSNELYEESGSFTITSSLNGPQFDVKIRASRSSGIKNMQIFCFDLMLTELLVKRGLGPGFLIHDSHLFDGVDERQVAKALQLGAKKASELGFQYIITMNSDALPKEGFLENFNISDFVLETRLTDATENGGLFGFRFS